MQIAGQLKYIVKEIADDVIGEEGQIIPSDLGDFAVRYKKTNFIIVYQIERMREKGIFPYIVRKDADGVIIDFRLDGNDVGYNTTPPRKTSTSNRTFTGNNNTNVVVGDVLGDVVTNDKEIILRLLDTNAKLVRLIETLTQNK